MTQIGRLAMRQEGKFWMAYYALNNTMEGAVFLGSVAVGGIADHPERKEAFMMIMRDIVSDILEERLGHRPDWGNPRPGPEHERGGNA